MGYPCPGLSPGTTILALLPVICTSQPALERFHTSVLYVSVRIQHPLRIASNFSGMRIARVDLNPNLNLHKIELCSCLLSPERHVSPSPRTLSAWQDLCTLPGGFDRGRQQETKMLEANICDFPLLLERISSRYQHPCHPSHPWPWTRRPRRCSRTRPCTSWAAP